MKFSEKWLREWVNPSLSTKALCDKLTMAGFEIDSIVDAREALTADEKEKLIQEIPIGADLSQYLQLEDTLIEVDVTPNRGDCLSIQGIAREIAVITETSLSTLPQPVLPKLAQIPALEIQIEAAQACPRYLARVIQDIHPTSTPLWLKERLRRSDIRSIHPVVDILNYVMLEVGQPMHAFDAQKVQAPLRIRHALEGEKLILLDGQTVTLTSQTLIIADSQGPLALAGIMGGQLSSVGANTHTIILESALFTPHLIAGKARSYGLHTDSSARFERGVDPELQLFAMQRATELICEICQGKPGPILEQVSAQDLPKREWITLENRRIKGLLGHDINPAKIVQILEKLGCTVEPQKHKEADLTWQVLPPSFRGDMMLDVDLIEEIVRIFGYDNIPTTMPVSHLQFTPLSSQKVPLARIKRALIDMGYQEVITYSFVDEALQKQLFSQEALALVNPISADMNVMRLSLWPGLLTTLKFNQNRQQHRLKIFETGLRFQTADHNLHQESVLGGLVCGEFAEEQWGIAKRTTDFFDVKNTLISLWDLLGQTQAWIFEPAEHLACHPGQCADIIWQGEKIGILGRLHPRIEKALDLHGPVYLFEVLLRVFNHVPSPVFERPSRFPEIRRDIAVIVDEQVSSGSLISYIQNSGSELLRHVRVFDVYSGKGIDSGRKSVALGLILQHPSRTLVDKEVDEVVRIIVTGLEKEFAAKLRE